MQKSASRYEPINLIQKDTLARFKIHIERLRKSRCTGYYSSNLFVNIEATRDKDEEDYFFKLNLLMIIKQTGVEENQLLFVLRVIFLEN